MPTIELAWEDGCPHVDAARANLAEALAAFDGPKSWREWRRGDVTAPAYASRAGSPAIFVDGRDVEGIDAGAEACCRVYVDKDGRRAFAPAVEVIVSALRRAHDR